MNTISKLYDVINYVTKYPLENKISFIFNGTGNQTIQIYSPEKPNRVLQNSTILKEYNSTTDLNTNYGWFYNSTEKILYIKFDAGAGYQRRTKYSNRFTTLYAVRTKGNFPQASSFHRF